MDRVAGPVQLRAGHQHALDGRRAAGLGGQEIAQRQVCQAHVEVGDGRRLAPVEPHPADQAALRELEIQRVDGQQAMVERHIGREPAQRPFGGDHRSGFVAHLGVHALQAIPIERRIGQQAARRCRRSRAGGRGLRTPASHSQQVGEHQPARSQIGGDRPPAVGLVERGRALEIAVAHLAVQAGERELGLLPVEMGGEAVGRRRRQGDGGQMVEVGQVRPAGGHLGLDFTETERLDQPAIRGHMGLARPHIELEVIGLGPLHVDQGPAGRLQAEGVLVHGPLAGQLEALAAALVGLRGVDHAGEGQVAARVLHRHVAVADHETLDRGQLEGLGRLLRIELPVGLVVLVADQVDLRLDDAEQRQVELADEQWQQPGAHVDLADVGEIARTGPFRIADPEAADLGARRPRPGVHPKMALDAHLSAEAAGGVARNRSAQPVPVEQQNEQHGPKEHSRDD